MEWMNTDEERKACLDKVCTQILDQYIQFSYHKPPVTFQDQTFQYTLEILSAGCFYMEYADAIKEADGERILRCWRYLLPIFQLSNRTNYSNEVLNMLLQYHVSLSERHAQQLIWSRCVNVHGIIGNNIPMDLHMEHLNRIAKEAMKGLGANKTPRAIERIGKALGTIAPILDIFDKECGVSSVFGLHAKPTIDKDVKIAVEVLQKSQVFKKVANRKHSSFHKVHAILNLKERGRFEEWLLQKLHNFH